jgi:hypothetical protein
MPPCGVWTQKAVPVAMVDEVVAEYKLDNPTKIDKIDNHNGTFDIVATFPACPDGSSSNQPAT